MGIFDPSNDPRMIAAIAERDSFKGCDGYAKAGFVQEYWHAGSKVQQVWRELKAEWLAQRDGSNVVRFTERRADGFYEDAAA